MTPSSPPRLSVVVPAYNEAHRLERTLRTMLAFLGAQPYTWDITVVDDGSTDGTSDVVTRLAAAEPRLRIARHEPNRGKGYAVRYGMLHTTGDLALFSDADLATPIEELDVLLEAISAGADVAVGSRDVPGSRLERRQSVLRELGGKLFNRCVQMLAVPGIQDTQCGFKLFTRASAVAVFSQCTIDGFSFDVEALYLARRLGYRIAEVPVRWRHQDGSKVRVLRDAPRMLGTLWRIRTTRYPAISRETDARSSP